MLRLFAFLLSWLYSSTPDDSTTKTVRRKRRRSTKARPSKSAYPCKLVRRIARRHAKGLTCRSKRAYDRRRKWGYFIGEVFAVQRRGWMMKNRVRKKIGRVPIRFSVLAKKESGFAPPIKLAPTRKELKREERRKASCYPLR
jgi:hypothetical protein